MDAVATIKQHQSLRNFTGAAINREQMTDIEDAIIQTSSTCFLQWVTAIKIRNKNKLALIAELSGHQVHIANCDTFFLFCLDVTKLEHISGIRPPYGLRFLIGGLNDCSAACQNALTAAESLGLGGVIIGGYKAGIKGISDLLKLPKGVVPLLGLCLGVPDESYREAQKPRLPRSWLIMEEEFTNPWDKEGAQAEYDAYDQAFKNYYQNRKHNPQDDTWSSSAQAYLGKTLKPAAAIIAYLKEQGFDFF